MPSASSPTSARRQQLGQAAVPDDLPLREFVETYWRLHAMPNLAPSTRDFYLRAWTNLILPRLGDHGVRELTPKRLTRFREELERGGVGAATTRKTLAIVQSILRFAVAEELVEYNATASIRKPRYERAREPHICCQPTLKRSAASSRTSGTARSSLCSPTRVRAPKRSCFA